MPRKEEKHGLRSETCWAIAPANPTSASSVWCRYQIPRSKSSSPESADSIALCSKVRLISAAHPPQTFSFLTAPLLPQHHSANFLSGIR